MVEILCPHCEEEIELDDDAKGEFACPYCEGEFEWGMDDNEDEGEFNFLAEEIATTNDVLTEYSDYSVLRITAGVIFSILMGIYALMSILIIFGGLFVSAAEDVVGDATGVESNFGAIVILIGVLMLLYHIAGLVFGILMAKGKFFALITCAALSGVTLIGTIVSWATDDSEECVAWETDDFMGLEYCSEYGDPSFPVFGVIIWIVMLGMMGTLIFVPKFRHQFH